MKRVFWLKNSKYRFPDFFRASTATAQEKTIPLPPTTSYKPSSTARPIIRSCVDTLQRKSNPIIEKAYQQFLHESADPEERECFEDENQITEIFVHGNYLSYEDIRVAKTCDVSLFVTNDNYANICSLADTLKKKYPDEE